MGSEEAFELYTLFTFGNFFLLLYNMTRLFICIIHHIPLFDWLTLDIAF